jgi:hypothetical protein
MVFCIVTFAPGSHNYPNCRRMLPSMQHGDRKKEICPFSIMNDALYSFPILKLCSLKEIAAAWVVAYTL